MKTRRIFPAFAFLLLAACSGAPDRELPVEVLQPAPLALDIRAQGQVRAVNSTPLKVPGRNWTRQQLSELLPDGSFVKKGDVIARFSPAQGELQLAEALLEVERNALARAAKQDTLAATVGRINATANIAYLVHLFICAPLAQLNNLRAISQSAAICAFNASISSNFSSPRMKA